MQILVMIVVTTVVMVMEIIAEFDGVDDYVNCGNNTSLALSDFTISCKVNPTKFLQKVQQFVEKEVRMAGNLQLEMMNSCLLLQISLITLLHGQEC